MPRRTKCMRSLLCVCVCVLRAYVSRLPANVVCIKVNIFWFVTRLLVIGWVVIVRGSIAPALALPCACICVCVSECHMVIWHGTAVTEFPTYCNHKIKNCTIQWGREETRCATTLCIDFDVNGTTFNTHKKYIPKKKNTPIALQNPYGSWHSPVSTELAIIVKTAISRWDYSPFACDIINTSHLYAVINYLKIKKKTILSAFSWFWVRDIKTAAYRSEIALSHSLSRNRLRRTQITREQSETRNQQLKNMD